MANDISLLKPGLKTALAEALYNEILSNTNNYYYFLGKPLEWTGGSTAVEAPLNTIVQDASTRREIVFLKKVTSSDVAFTIPRYDWISGQVYDQYDDRVGDNTTVTATAGANTFTLTGTFDLSTFGQKWLVTGTGIPSGTFVDEATATTITLTKRTTAPVTSVTLTKVTPNGASSIETSKFYVLTSARNVYKCLYNNNGAPSTVQPYSTTHEPITTSDGYVWKFMYTIPNALVNKFMSLFDMPVTTAVKSAYYSRGAITSAIVEAYGTGYEPGDYLVVTGDGSLTDNVYSIKDVIIENGGEGYVTAPTVTVDPPYLSTLFATTTTYVAGQYVHVITGAGDKIIYEVVSGGTSGSAAPTHTSVDPVTNGTCSLKFVGAGITATATIVGGAVTGVSMKGIIANVRILSSGSGYNPLNPPSVVIGGDGFGATAVAEVSHEGYITDIKITNRGTGYTTAAATIDPPTISSITFNGSSTSVVSVANNTITYTGHGFVTGDRVKYNNGGGSNTSIGGLSLSARYYVIAVNANTIKLSTSFIGAVNGTGIVDITSVGTGTNHILLDDFEAATAEVDVYHGYGYSVIPAIVASDPFTATYDYANQTVVAVNDIIRSGTRFYRVTAAVAPYKLGPEIPSITQGSMTCGNCTLLYIGQRATFSLFTEKTKAHLIPIIENGQIIGVIAQDPGIGYTTASIATYGQGAGAIITPNLSFGDLNTRQANTELLAIPGTIDAIDVLHSGINYAWANVTVEGDGVGCTAQAVISQGAITKIVVTDPGYGYTYANVVITGNGAATQAYARAIISPFTGHGKDAVRELYAKDVAIATTVARDRNQGFVVNNDYRQLGVIKNPTAFNSTQRFTKFNGSTCYAVTGNFTYHQITNDMVMTDADGNRFIVVAKPSTEPLDSNVQLLVQAIDNKPPVVGGTLTYNNTMVATLSVVTEPTVDKYSGEIMFIDNRRAFQPTDDQTLSIKTVIRL